MAAEQVPGAAGQVDPVLPGPDEPGSPFAPHYVGDALGGGQRQHPQRVAVQVDQRRVVTGEALAEAGERIGRVALCRKGPVAGNGRHASTLIRGAQIWVWARDPAQLQHQLGADGIPASITPIGYANPACRPYEPTSPTRGLAPS